MTEARDPIVRTGLGSVRGRWVGSVARFLGIPFAEPPVGRRRFAAPEPRAPWDGELDAGAYGATPQRVADRRALIPEPSIAGKDTLSLNVWTPSPGQAASLPVLVCIHGGGYTTGSPASPWYDGTAFARDGVVAVTVAYRLGFDGFGWIDGAPQNRGVRDWLCALEWVQRHIAAFGGDPARVTVAGQSAGGGAVLTLLGMPQARDLLAAGWAMSPAVTDVTESAARRLARRMATNLGVAPTREGFASVSEGRILGQQPVVRRERSLDPFAAVERGLALGPTIDGELLPRSTYDALSETASAGVPLVIGATHDEFALATPQIPTALRPVAPHVLRMVPGALPLAATRLPSHARREYLRANPDARRRGVAAVVCRYASDLVFGGAILGAASARAPAPTWVYRFDWASPTLGWAVHCLDVPFAFDVLDAPGVDRVAGAAPPQEVADAVHGAMVRLATTHEPGWDPWREDARLTRIFGGDVDVDPAGWARVEPLEVGGIVPRRSPR